MRRVPPAAAAPAASGGLEGTLMSDLGLVRMAAAHLDLPEVDEHLGGLDGVVGQQPQHGVEVRDRLVVGAACCLACSAARRA